MPLSHLTLTVSHLPTSTSFFLSCLQPLGYKFIGRHDDYIGFGQHSGEPADFWITEEKPGVPPGAAHVAFPAPSKDAVGTFFIAALKAGGKLHGEPKTRDSETGYYSAAVMDFDGNSIEAVYRPGLSLSSGASSASSVARSEVSRPALKLLENGSVVSKASSVSKGAPSTVKYAASRGAPTIVSKAPSVQRSVAPSERGGPASVMEKSVAAPTPTYVVHHTTTTQKDEGTTAKTIVGTLIGAAAGAAIAYAMSKGDSESSSSTSPTHQQHNQQQLPSPQEHGHPGGEFARHLLEAPLSQVQSHITNTLRAIEAPPASGGRSTYSSPSEYNINNNRPSLTRSVTSKNPRASTIYEGTEYVPPGGGGGYTDQYGRRASDNASMYSGGSQRDLPLRAIEYPPTIGPGGEHYPCDRSTLISSFPDKSRAMSVDMGVDYGKNGGGSVYSTSTIKASKANGAGYEEYTSSRHSTHSHSHRSSHSRHSTSRRSSHAGVGSGKGGDRDGNESTTKSARNIPLPDSTGTASLASYRSNSHSHANGGNQSTVSARDIPLPESMYGDDVGPEDSISQIGDSRRSSHSRHSTAKSHRSSKFDEPVRPSDSVSQVSSHASRASQRTVRGMGKDVASSRVGGSSLGRRGSQVV